MRIIISIKVLSALAEIADGANGAEYSDKIAFFPETNNIVACNGHVLASISGACDIEGGDEVITLSAKRAKGILSEVKTDKVAKALGKIFLFSTQEEYNTFIEKQQQTKKADTEEDTDTKRYDNVAFSFIPDYGYIPADGLKKFLTEKSREASDFVPTFNLKYLKKISKLWNEVSESRNDYDPRYDEVYYGASNTLHLRWGDSLKSKDFHAIVMPYRYKNH